MFENNHYYHYYYVWQDSGNANGKEESSSSPEERSANFGVGINMSAKKRSAQVTVGQFDDTEDSRKHSICSREMNFKGKASSEPCSNLSQGQPQITTQAAPSDAAGVPHRVGDCGFTPCCASTPQRTTSLSHCAPTSCRATSVPHCTPTPQQKTSISHFVPSPKRTTSLSYRVPPPLRLASPSQCSSAPQQKTLPMGRGRGDFLKALGVIQPKPTTGKSTGDGDISVVKPVWGHGQALQHVLNMKK